MSPLPTVSTVPTYAEKIKKMASQSIEEKARARTLREQAELAKLPIVGSPKPLIRAVHDFSEGLIIGDQRDATKCNLDRRAAQQVYKEQLRKDTENNALRPLSPRNVSKVAKHKVPPEDKTIFSTTFIIGKNKEVEDEERRSVSNQLKEQAQRDMSEKSKYKLLEQQHLEKLLIGIDVGNGYLIGAGEESARIAQKEAKREHIAQLTADRNKMSVNLTDTQKNNSKEDGRQYLNATGYQIGDLSSDGDKVMLRLHAAQKFTKQALYRQALYDQQTLRAQIEREKKFAEIGDFSTNSVPYMR